MTEVDIAIIGAGIAGAGVAAMLPENTSAVILEMERSAGYHTTGRSAAMYAETYGPAPIRALTRASGAFYRTPPDGFAGAPLLSPRGTMMIARADQREAAAELVEEVQSFEVLGPDEVRDRVPLLREGYASQGLYDKDGEDIDVEALHQGFLRMARAKGTDLRTGGEVLGLSRIGGAWEIETRSGPVRADVVINAAGAWAGELGKQAGGIDIGLVPKRRTALLIADPAETQSGPLVVDVEEAFYLKPQSGKLLISPADETPSPPTDAQPEDWDVAVAVDRIETAFDLSVRKIESKWAGLRSFVPDKSPVVGFDPQSEGLFWLAAQGGYGIQSAPALSRLAAAQACGKSIPSDIIDFGLDPATISPDRL